VDDEGRMIVQQRLRPERGVFFVVFVKDAGAR
jgi:hypothetical protein